VKQYQLTDSPIEAIVFVAVSQADLPSVQLSLEEVELLLRIFLDDASVVLDHEIGDFTRAGQGQVEPFAWLNLIRDNLQLLPVL
jgi:hypothetical protein